MQPTLQRGWEAINDGMNPEGLVLSLLDFGILLMFPVNNCTIPHQTECMRALQMSWLEIKHSGYIYDYREHWCLKLLNQARQILVLVEKYWFVRKNSRYVSGLDLLKYYKAVKNLCIWTTTTATGNTRLHKLNSMYKLQNALPDCMSFIWRQYTSGHQELSIFVDEVLDIIDPRIKSHDFAEGRKKGLKGLIKVNRWKVVKKTSLPSNANTLNGIFVLSTKNKESKNEV